MIQRTLILASLTVSYLSAASIDDSLFFEKTKHLEFMTLRDLELSTEQDAFLKGMALVTEGDFDSARTIFGELNATSKDTVMVESAREVLGSIYLYESQWDSLVRLGIPHDEGDFLSFVKAYQLTDAESYLFPEKTLILPMKLSLTGTPIIEVEINGHRRRFWLDTGAGLSVLSSDAARDCGIIPLSAVEAKALTSTTKKVGIQPAEIKEMRIGGVEVHNHPAVIIDSENLEFKMLGITFMKIDGIIGWNLIQNLDITIDYSKKRISIRKPQHRPSPSPALFWLDYPIVAASSGGVPLHFFLDTGASGTGIYENAFRKLTFENIRASTNIVGGAGGMERFETKKVEKLELVINGENILLKNVTSYPERDAGFLKLDGILGADAFKGRRVHIDVKNGKFEVY